MIRIFLSEVLLIYVGRDLSLFLHGGLVETNIVLLILSLLLCCGLFGNVVMECVSINPNHDG